MDITLKLYKSQMMYAVENDTHIVAQNVFNSENTSKASFGLQADSDPAKQKLLQSMQVGVQEVKNVISYFIQGSGSSSASNAQLTMSNDDDAITFVLSVSSRFNKAFTETLTMHCHNYIVNRMLRDWFLTSRKDLAGDYQAMMKDAVQNIQASFFKLPPSAPVHNG